MRPKQKAKLKKKVAFATASTPAAPEPASDDEDLHLSDDDLALLEEYGAKSSFLTRIDAAGLQKNGKKAPNVALKRVIPKSFDDDDDDYAIRRGSDGDADDDDGEVDYEGMKRELKDEWKPQEFKPARLPIIDSDGQVVRSTSENSVKKRELPSDLLASAKEKAAARKQVETENAARKAVKLAEKIENEKRDATASEAAIKPKKKISPQEARVQAQEQLAGYSNAVLENPEENMGALKIIRSIGECTDGLILKLCLLSQLAIFKDIVPGYRIRPLTEVEKEQKVSKEVKKLRSFEEGILANYQAYLQQLDGSMRYHLGKKSGCSYGGSPDPSVAVVAAKCMAELLNTLSHFNFRNNLLTAIVSFMNTTKPLDVGIICCNAIKMVFENDPNGDSSLDAVRLIFKLIKNKDFKVGEEVVKTFLHLRLKDELPHANDSTAATSRKRKSEKVHLSKKTRKLDKKYKEIEKEMKEAEAEYDVEERQKKHTETLKHVFMTYFRILKNADASALLPAVLEGLSRFAHLINMDFFGDIIKVLKKITQSQFQKIEDGVTDGSSTKSALHCIIAAFQLLTGQGEAINIDLKDFNTSLYSQLLRLPMNPDYASVRKPQQSLASQATEKHMADARSRSEIELALMGIDLLFCRKNQVPIARAAAFVKRLATVSLHMPSNAVLACLSMLRALFVKHPRLQQLLATDEQLGAGSYKPYLNDPELCNPFGSSLWELSILMNHFHPTVRSLAKHVAQTNSTTTATSNSVSNYRPLPADLNVPPLTMLWKFDHFPQAPRPDFGLVPRASIPANVVSALKRKVERGIKVVDGPSVVDESDFMREIESAVGADDENDEEVVSTGDAVLDRLIMRERKLRKLADVARMATLDLLPEEDDDLLDEDAEDDEDIGYDDDEGFEEDDDTWKSVMRMSGKKLNGSQRAEKFLASIGAPRKR